MKLLNVGCGAVRPGEPWTNLDNLWEQLQLGTPERVNLDSEPNYINHPLLEQGDMPFNNDTFDGILCSHVIEHFDCHQAVRILSDCRRILKPGGVLVVSVPDAEYFLRVHAIDTPDSAVELFGEPICPDEPWHKSFFDYALFYNQHKQILSNHSLKCILLRSGFIEFNVRSGITEHTQIIRPEIMAIEAIMNRRKFSLEMVAIK